MFSEDILTLAENIIKHASKHSIHISTVESCTGGLVCGALTEISGSSAVVAGGLITYSNALKQSLAHVKSLTLEQFGAVSEETALEMAKGGQTATSSNLTVSITGIAGPEGGTPEKPVGTVWFAISSDHSIHAERKLFTGNREAVRTQAVHHALTLLEKELHRF